MMSTTNEVLSRKAPTDYAGIRTLRRERAAARLSKRVVHPVQAETTHERGKKIPPWVGAWGYGGLALAFHLALAGILISSTTRSTPINESEAVVFQFVEKDAPPEPEEMDDDAVEPEPEPVPEVKPEPAPEVVPAPKQPKLKRVKMARADPVNRSEPEPTPEPRKRAVVGITMSSTVTGGSGEAYAVGNTRMGTTAAVQSAEKIETLSKGRVSGAGGGSEMQPVNRQATFIPTVSSHFSRPKRLSSVDLPYPPDLKSKGIEGNVMVLIVIDEKGAVQKVRILKSSGYREFDAAALEAAKKELYSPAVKDGKAVEYNLKYTYRFRMKGA